MRRRTPGLGPTSIGHESVRALRARQIFLIALFTAVASRSASGTELKKTTADAFNHYVRVTEARMDGEGGNPKTFLWLDRLPDQSREEILAELRQGRVVTEQLQTREDGKPIPVPDGMVHHWIATIFIPGATLRQALGVIQDYNHHQETYKFDIERSKLLSTDGTNFHVYFRLYRRSIVTVTYNTQVDVRFFPVDATHESSRSRAIRIAEVDDPGKPDEHEKPVGDDHGYLWRLNTYSRYAERDGGVYIQVEFVALSRSVPAFLAWFVNPYIKSVPREYLTRLLESTRDALLKRKSVSSIEEDRPHLATSTAPARAPSEPWRHLPAIFRDAA